MRYVTILAVCAALGLSVLICPDRLRAQVARAVVPDETLAMEIHAAMRGLIDQLGRMAPEFGPQDDARSVRIQLS